MPRAVAKDYYPMAISKQIVNAGALRLAEEQEDPGGAKDDEEPQRNPQAIRPALRRSWGQS